MNPYRKLQQKRYEAAARKVALAWLKPGRNPGYHYEQMKQVRKSMPRLAQYLDELAKITNV